MVTPIVIQVIFWVGAIGCILGGLIVIIWGARHGAADYVFKGLALLVLGPLAVRIYCEIMVVFFRINETLTEIKHTIEEREPPRQVKPAGG